MQTFLGYIVYNVVNQLFISIVICRHYQRMYNVNSAIIILHHNDHIIFLQ